MNLTQLIFLQSPDFLSFLFYVVYSKRTVTTKIFKHLILLTLNKTMQIVPLLPFSVDFSKMNYLDNFVGSVKLYEFVKS